MLLQIVLPCPDLAAVVVLGKNQVCLDPGNSLSCIDQQLRESVRRQLAAFVQFVAAFFGDRFDATLHGYAACVAQEVERFLVPQVDARLQADGDRPLRKLLQQPADVLANSKNFVDPVNVLHAARDQRVNFRQHRFDITLAEFVSK